MIGKQLKQYLDIPESAKIGFSVFVSWRDGGLGNLCCGGQPGLEES